jgi:hypothetical protein
MTHFHNLIVDDQELGALLIRRQFNAFDDTHLPDVVRVTDIDTFANLEGLNSNG